MVLLIFFLFSGMVFSQELNLKKVIEDTLRKNLELKAYRYELKALENEFRAAKASLFPNLKFEEIYTKTNVPAYVLFTKLNQEKVKANDFTPSNLNNPEAISNFETRFTAEIPIWIGGKIRALRDVTLHRKVAGEMEFSRREEEIIFKAYRAYLSASLARSVIEVAKKNLEDAKEHLRVAKKLQDVGMALLSDVLRTEVLLKKAEERVIEAEENYKIAKKTLGLIANSDYTGYQIKGLKGCPDIPTEKLLNEALVRREDLKALDEKLKVVRDSFRAILGDTLPHVTAFASYHLYSGDAPLGANGEGYMFGLRVSFGFNTGLGVLHKARSFKEKERALKKRKKYLEKVVLLSVERALSDYRVAKSNLVSAERRIREAEEILRILKVRFRNGMARVVDLLDAQTQLEKARFDYIQALYKCNLSYGKALLEAGLIKEVLR